MKAKGTSGSAPGKHRGSGKSGAAGRAGNSAGNRGKAKEVPAWMADLPVKIGQQVEAEIVGISHDGEGVGRANGFTLFVAGALPGERALVRVEHLKKQYGYAALVELLETSPDRVAPDCLIYEECGGCQLQHLSYEAQLRVKRQQVVDNLVRIGKLENIIVHPTLGMADPWRYRNKAQVPFGEERGGLIGGFYAQGSHRIIDMEACLIQHEANDEVVARVKEIGSRLGIRAYREETGTGLLRHVVVKVGFRTGEIMVVLVTNGADIPRVDEWVAGIREALPAVKSICHNINVRQTNVIFGDETRVLWGSEVIYDYIGDVKFAISARSFFQVNPVQTEVLYGKALEYAALTGGETVVDAYCGIGTISLFLAQRAGQVYGVEIVEEAISDARKNAALNGMMNVHFEAGPAEVVLPEWTRQGVRPDVIVVDPPRKGCDPALLATILELRPRRVVYVSCSASTLARDLRVLVDGGYGVAEVTPVDMFPHTVHVESVALLVR
ncbi:23S rRNA (uracil(1939)-C(5))-methyltransferase RlmD [Paenibacillus roseipurpureus]|uniref:23S rRNA (Uracil(1939)-C(5))-methyltransferase RlmD n=1 Tax=Paenibacillus roseopurpureus TaxID=2918901 RepID=A0AA96LS74_9BACL|nr:23S rRNA (uracil(1939)-C(5))-methyltransferase RlmD [Paenibacillus sp. MBLB1832]WNR45099.1 23S rRNA (uracil(1939)-C(5))-methyltransferase RlmD [Paenibacillus sp. MBLB1832]